MFVLLELVRVFDRVMGYGVRMLFGFLLGERPSHTRVEIFVYPSPISLDE